MEARTVVFAEFDCTRFVREKNMAQDNYDKKYTDPDLRREVKEEIRQSDKGGKPGQWSARKSQHLVQEYEKRGGGYKQDKLDKAAKSLEKWSEQDWQTEGGKAEARQDNVTERYLPKEAWDKLSKAEKQEAERTKEEASKQGKQHVEWTLAIQRVMHEIEHKSDDEKPKSNQKHKSNRELSKKELYEQAQDLNIAGRSKMSQDELIEAVRKAKS